MISKIRQPMRPTSQLARRRMLQLAAAVPLGLAVARAAWAAPSPDAAQSMVEAAGQQVLAILRDPALSNDDKLHRLVQVLDGPIDLALVGRLILGRYWRTASEAQQTEYLGLFRAYALNNLASRLHLYQGQSFKVTGAQAADDKDTLVTSQILGDRRPPLSVDWRIRDVDGSKLVAIDLVVEGVSLIISQRAEFSTVIDRSGMDGLLAELRQRAEKA